MYSIIPDEFLFYLVSSYPQLVHILVQMTLTSQDESSSYHPVDN